MPAIHAPETCRDGGSLVLVTGFGAFPGAPVNPSAAILTRLARHRGRLARLGIVLETRLLPVIFEAIEPALAAQAAALKPDAILHLGLARRRRVLSVETRAINRAGPLHPDAAGRRPAQTISAGSPSILPATYPASRILRAIRAQGVAAKGSIDAGDYVCNTTLYLTLRHQTAPLAGFLHLPRLHVPSSGRATQPRGREVTRRPNLDDLTRAVLAAILVLAKDIRRLANHIEPNYILAIPRELRP
jgi:pyroglutamyl-peptidase